jgi:hypothetical protein
MQHDVFTELYGANAFDDPQNYTADGQFKPRGATSWTLRLNRKAASEASRSQTRASLPMLVLTPRKPMTSAACACKTRGARTSRTTSISPRRMPHKRKGWQIARGRRRSRGSQMRGSDEAPRYAARPQREAPQALGARSRAASCTQDWQSAQLRRLEQQYGRSSEFNVAPDFRFDIGRRRGHRAQNLKLVLGGLDLGTHA